VCVYASAPTFTHGVIDPVEALGVLCSKRKLGLHVDNCLGGFLLSFMQRAGLLGDTKFDFQVPGVTSMSVDVHK
jgi:sphinganine-1-phosphate aldolase